MDAAVRAAGSRASSLLVEASSIVASFAPISGPSDIAALARNIQASAGQVKWRQVSGALRTCSH